jgi:peroxiredoxin
MLQTVSVAKINVIRNLCFTLYKYKPNNGPRYKQLTLVNTKIDTVNILDEPGKYFCINNIIMMKKILSMALLVGSSLAALAQKSEQMRFFLPNGKEIKADQLDSVKKAWGNRDPLMSHDDEHPNEMHLSPMTDAYIKQMKNEKEELQKLLNKPAPDFSLSDLSGKVWKLSALKGKIVVLNFWFTTCPGCVQEMPELNQLKKRFTVSDVVFLALTFNDAETIRVFLKNHPFNYTILPKAQPVCNAYHINSYPTSVIIDPKGIIRFLQVGGTDIKEKLTKLITDIRNK